MRDLLLPSPCVSSPIFYLFFFLFSLWKLYRGRRSTFSASLYFKDVAFARPERVSCSCGTAQVYGGDAKLQQTLRCVSWKRLLKLCWGASKHSSTLLPAQQLEAPQFKGSRWHLKAPYQRHFQICTLCDAGPPVEQPRRVYCNNPTKQTPCDVTKGVFFVVFSHCVLVLSLWNVDPHWPSECCAEWGL